MDPFSIVVGAVALTETANKLAGALTDRYKAFSSAPKQMVEIAGQITLCAGLVDVFAKSVDGTGRPFPRMFESDAASLVRQWLSDDYKAPDNEFYPAYSEPDRGLKDGYSTPTPRTPIETYSPIDHRSSDPFEPSEIDFGHVIPASSRRSFSQVSSSPPLRRAVGVCDWRCDGCDGKFFYRESRLKCQQCVDFDFCPGCFETVSHRHPKSSFARISG
ncbi:unnamed protein product [Diplocarpon coronariae]